MRRRPSEEGVVELGGEGGMGGAIDVDAEGVDESY